MTRIVVPYHIDEYLPGLDLPGLDLPGEGTVVTAALDAADPWDRLAQLYGPVADAVAGAGEGAGGAGARAVVVCSGDCATAIGTVAGLQRAGHDPAVVWFDGHGDVQTMETTESGYLGGMPLRVLVGYRPGAIVDTLGLRAVAEDRVVLSDARDLDRAEAAYLAGSAVRVVPVGSVASVLPDGPLYVHVDLDVVDPGELPGLRFPASGGPDLAAVFAAVGAAIDTGRVVGLGIACSWHPGHGNAARVQPYLDRLLGE